MGYAPAPGMMAPTANYEFNELENTQLASTARFAKLWGIISLVSGILLLLMGILITVMMAGVTAAAAASSSSTPGMSPAAMGAIGIGLIPSALVSIIGGIFYMNSGSALSSVVTTQGNDIPLLMNAIKGLSRAFMIEAIAMAIGFVLGFILGLVLNLQAAST